MKNILFILDDYPTETTNGCVFVRKLILEMLRQGVECTVIAPRIIGLQNRNDKAPYHSIDYADKNTKIDVYRPWYLHLSSSRYLMRTSMDNHLRAVWQTIRREHLQPDYVYGHFIYQCGITAARIGERMKIPSFCAVGENSKRLMADSEPYATGRRYGDWCRYLNKLSGIISVSEYNYQLICNNGFVTGEQAYLIAPNGVDNRNFHYIDRSDARKRLGLPQEKFIVAFTGAFSERKGFHRLCEALDKMDDVYSIFMGKGDSEPTCKNVLWCGSVPNNELKYYLCAADIFTLPTNGEGCCNAIIEALACGLPVVSSDLPFNDGVLTAQNSVRIDVTDIDAIRNAIEELKRNADKRRSLSQGAIISAESMSNSTRAANILNFMGIK